MKNTCTQNTNKVRAKREMSGKTEMSTDGPDVALMKAEYTELHSSSPYSRHTAVLTPWGTSHNDSDLAVPVRAWGLLIPRVNIQGFFKRYCFKGSTL